MAAVVKKSADGAESAPEDTVESTCVDEEAWTVRDVNTTVINRPQDWTSQDYVNAPPETVTWERPFDSI